MIKNRKSFIKTIIFFAFSIFLLSSCKDKIMGYSVVLWNAPAQHLRDCDVVPVYIRSNISQVYVISDAEGTKVELPLWQLTEPVKKSKIDAVLKKYEGYAHTYASVKTDGLPARSDPVNTSKQVYRLRKNEVIKILYKGKGTAPMTGGVPLEGDWYRILTADGTQGWCFSYNLIFFETDENGQAIGNTGIVEEEEEDERYLSILNKVWYPDSFRTMIQTGNMDLSKLHSSYNFMIDTENKKVTLNLSKIHESWDYQGYTKSDDNQFTLKDIPAIIIFKKYDYIVIRYTGPDGKPQELNFVTIKDDLNEIISNERQRRTDEYGKLVENGPRYSSSSYGTLVLNSDGTFQWTNYKLLVPSIISAAARNVGTASIKYNVSKALSENYDGVLTFKFDNTSEEVNFLYKIDANRLRLEDATEATYNGNLITAKGSSPTIISFTVK